MTTFDGVEEMSMKPPFSYYGGKQRMASKIVPLIPKHTVYVEPFAGSAAVMFAKPWPDVTDNNHYCEVLNDHSSDIINFFRVLRDYPDDLVRVCCLTPYSREEYTLTQNIEGDNLERARKFFINVSQSFAYKVNGGWGTSVYGRNVSVTWQNTCSRLCGCAERLSSVCVEHDDALKVIKRWDSPQTLFYCDPPYPDTHQGHYDGYTREDFRALVTTLGECQGSFVLSCYDQPGIPEYWERFEFATNCGASGQGRVGKGRDKTKVASGQESRKRTEVVWRVVRGQNVRPEIRKLYEQGKFDCFKDPPVSWYGT